MGFPYAQAIRNGERHVALNAVPDPSCANMLDPFDLRDMKSCMFHLLKDMWVHAVQQSNEDGFRGSEDDDEDCNCNAKSDNGICYWVSQPNAECANQNRQARETIYPSMMPVRHKGCRINLA